MAGKIFMSTAALSIGAVVLSGCVPGFGDGVFNGPVVADEKSADANGIIDYGEFRVIVANDGDTIQSLASRVNIQDVVLARYNGLPTNYLLRPGERLALPNSAQVAAVNDGWTPDVVTGVLDDLPDGLGSQQPSDAPGTQLLRHRVERGETAFSIARLYGVSVTALASWNGLSGDLELPPGRSLVIPPSGANARVIASPEPAPSIEPVSEQIVTDIAAPGATSPVPLPPSAEEPLPEDIATAPEIPDGPDLGSQTRPSSTRLLTPVGGKIVKGYSKTPGRDKNEGLDYQTEANAPVRAAADGEVALVSRSLGGLGTIVLVRHRDDIMTVYGRVKDVDVQKGDKVSRGQTIGRVADGAPPIFHFEVRRGTQSVDPTPFL